MEAGEERYSDRLYLQQILNSTVGPAIVEDYMKFDWHYVAEKKTKHNWGELTSNLLFIGMEGNVTPCHYDEQENFLHRYLDISDVFYLRQTSLNVCIPIQYIILMTDRVDFDRPDYNKFPKFKNLKGCETVVEPGDVLYIPIYWWHHVESLMRGGPTITVNFWYKAGPTSLEYPLKQHQKVSIMRNVEKMLLEVLQDPKEVGPLLRAMVLGRYTEQT
ncbi:hypothetical protein NQ317_017567 [Molorchus minor]|uniref:JmjC domain-containing protein n=1 Tax=Molorchus minor TaxID=1323400 RepID=A0ABQ9J6J4_9CUCU|nr:hypothetical protein NQ317_017567 [Molorchus minor]